MRGRLAARHSFMLQPPPQKEIQGPTEQKAGWALAPICLRNGLSLVGWAAEVRRSNNNSFNKRLKADHSGHTVYGFNHLNTSTMGFVFLFGHGWDDCMHFCVPVLCRDLQSADPPSKGSNTCLKENLVPEVNPELERSTGYTSTPRYTFMA
jgi:hypothetical protein